MPDQSRASSLWVWLNIALIACSALVVLTPLASNMLFRIAFGLIVGPVYLLVLIRRMRASGHGDSSIGQLYARARSGHRLPTDVLELAAAVALALAMFDPFKG